MATLTGKQISNSYKQLLQVGSNNSGLSGTVQTVQDGNGTNSALQLSNSAVNINGNFQLNGVTLTANASTLNAVADLTGATGIVAVSAGNVYGRTITGGTGVSITNGDGTEGNPTIALNTTGVVSGTYGPLTNLEINAVGQVVSATAVSTSVSVPTIRASEFIGGTFKGTTADFSSDTSIGGTAVIEGAATFNSTVSVSGALTGSSATFTGTVSAGDISGANATFSGNISATEYYGDGSNLTGIVAASATFATSAGFAASATNASFALSATNANFAASASFASSASYAASAGEASFAVSASSAAFATSADSATFAVSATNATTAYNVSGGIADISGLTAVSASISDLRATQFYGTSVSIDYLNASDITAITISATDLKSSTLSFTSVSVSLLRVYRLAVETTLSATYGTFTGNVSAVSFYGDGSNLTNLPTAPVSVSAYTVNQLTVVSAASFPDDATLNFGTGNDLQIVHNGSNSVIKETGTGSLFVQSNEIKLTNTGSFSMLTLADGQDADFPYGIQVSGTVSATSFVGPTITSINSVISNVSALTSVNAAAITSINTILGDGSNFATSAELAATSAALATSIATANTRITSVSDYAVALSATLATSIGNSNTNIAAVSVLTSINAAAITSINAIIEGNVSADSGTFNTLTVITSASIGGTLNVGGNVGIGTSSPSVLLDIEGSGYAGLDINGTSGGEIRLQTNGTTYADIYADTTALVIDSANSNQIIFSDSSTERARIDSSGNLLVGSTNTDGFDGTSGLKVASSTVGFLLERTGTRSWLQYIPSSGDWRLYDSTDNAVRMVVDSSGNVGIGTTSPVAQFESQAASGTLQTRTKVTGSTASDIAELAISTGTRTHLIQSKGSSGDFVIRDSTGAADRITMDTSGNVGIGTSSPTVPLHLKTVGSINPILNIEGTAFTPGIRMYSGGTAITPSIRYGTGTGGTALKIEQINTGAGIDGAVTERMRIDNSGNVGIGTSSPSAKLDVNGTLSAGATTLSVGAITSGGIKVQGSNSGAGVQLNNTSAAQEYLLNVTNSGNLLLYDVTGTENLLVVSAAGAFDFQDGNITTTGTLSAGATTVTTLTASGEISGTAGIAVSGGTSNATIDIALPNTNYLAWYDSGGSGNTNAYIRASSGNLNLNSQTITTINNALSAGETTVTRLQASAAGAASGAAGLQVSVGQNDTAALILGQANVLNWRIRNQATTGTLEFSGNTSGDVKMAISTSGNVGIGTASPAVPLDVNGAIRIVSQEYLQFGGTANRFGGDASINALYWQTNSAERMRIDSSGNVGIGTSSPAKQLHITKAAKADIGTLTDGATITPDFDANQNFSVTLGGNRTLANPSNIDAGQTGSIFVVQDGIGSRTLSFGSYWKFAGGTAPTLSTAAGAVDRIDYIVYTTTAIHAVATLNIS